MVSPGGRKGPTLIPLANPPLKPGPCKATEFPGAKGAGQVWQLTKYPQQRGPHQDPWKWANRVL